LRSSTGLLHCRAPCSDGKDRSALFIRPEGLDRAPAQRPAARGIRDRLLHSVRLHWHIHIRELRAGSRATVRSHDAGGVGLFRVPPLRRNDPSRRPVCKEARNSPDPLRVIGDRGGWFASAPASARECRFGGA
jgi:hypothetical protein